MERALFGVTCCWKMEEAKFSEKMEPGLVTAGLLIRSLKIEPVVRIFPGRIAIKNSSFL